MKKITILTLIFLVFVNLAVADWTIDENVTFTPALSNVTYIAPTGGFTCTDWTIDNYCLNITGGTYEGNYCLTANTTTNITIGYTYLDIIIRDEQTRELINQTVDIEIFDTITTYAANYTTSNGVLNLSSAPTEIEIRYNSDGYHQRSYYATLSTTQNNLVILYLINDSTSISSLVIQSVFDQNGAPAEDVTLKLQRNYINNQVSEFETVSMAKTNFEGEAVLYVELYDVWYKLLFLDSDGNILKETEPSPFLTQTPEEKISLAEDEYLSFREYDEVVYNLTFVNSSNITYARFIFSDTNNLVREGCLVVQRFTTDGVYNVCNNCSQSTSATLSCLINTSLDGQFKAVGLIDTNTINSYYTLDTLFYDALEAVDYGQQGVFYSTIIVGSMILMGVVSSITGSIMFMILGFISVTVMSFVVGFNLGIIWWIILLGMIVIFLTVRGKQL